MVLSNVPIITQFSDMRKLLAKHMIESDYHEHSQKANRECKGQRL